MYRYYFMMYKKFVKERNRDIKYFSSMSEYNTVHLITILFMFTQNYGFFDNIKEYLDQEKNFDSELEIGSDHFCAYIKDHSGKFPQITKYCKEFVNFFTFLKENIIRDSDLLLYNQYHEFLNYWLNDKLQGSSISDVDRTVFYNELDVSNYWFDKERKLKANIYDIENNRYIKMKLLYGLYKEYYELKDKDETYCSEFLNYCKDKYTNALKKCYYDRDVDFCEALKRFRSLYENNKSSIHSTCSKYSNLRKLISVHYNILEVYDKDKQKMSMMNILHEYLQYCNDNSTRSHLILFIEEFFENYYNEKKNVYEQIYKDCSVDTQSQKDYCEIYKKCITEFKCDFFLIEQNPEEYVNNKKELHQKMNKGGLWMENIARFFEKTSDISSSASVITGTVVALFFTTFALYKVLKNYI
ncbi:hypothetical protein PVBG_05800 [Plasmodium vivax Brazil I]|uniref:Uncharacterized protein n=1 Tax=Plasmodium vivax (strain Brazil I) TaxID=1033975 RepID=A0A0J9VLK3_PLAV1|nr:hypothetical protein PVBG_05800 [Plasmodium vivax Brazil I]